MLFVAFETIISYSGPAKDPAGSLPSFLPSGARLFIKHLSNQPKIINELYMVFLQMFDDSIDKILNYFEAVFRIK